MMTRNKHLATCDASTPHDKRCTSRDKRCTPCDKHLAPRKGFTLLEVLVALSVLAVGATALGFYAGAFKRASSAEIARADSALAAVQYMESLIADPPACAVTVYTRRASLTGDKQSLAGDKQSLAGDKQFLAGDKQSLVGDKLIPTSDTQNPASDKHTPPTITHIPATPSLQYLELRTQHFTFRRLVRCRKVSR